MTSKKHYFQIGSINVSIDNFHDSLFWQIWKWKLDPYIVNKQQESCELFISMEPSEEQILPQRLLSEEKAGFFRHRVYSTDNGELLWQYERIKNGDVIIKYLVSASMDKITLLEDNSNTGGNLAFEYLGQIMPSVLLLSNTITFHGVLMEYCGKGIIISAPSGTGKTTHARMWRDLHRALIINGDRSTCKKINGEWTGFGLPWSGTSGEQINRSVPITAMVVLEQSKENHAEILTGLEAFAAIMPNLQYPRWDAELTGTAMDLVDDFLSEIPVIRLYCRPDEEAVNVLKTTLENL